MLRQPLIRLILMLPRRMRWWLTRLFEDAALTQSFRDLKEGKVEDVEQVWPEESESWYSDENRRA